MKKICVVLAIVAGTFLINISGLTQDSFDNFFDSADPEFMKLKREADDRFAELRVIDAEFADILNRAWQELELSTGISPDTEPKPRVIPTARPDERPPIQPPQEAKPVADPEPEPAITPEAIEKYGTPITFFRTTFPLRYDAVLETRFTGRISEDAISGYWETLSSGSYEGCITQLLQVKKQLSLNDWGYCLLLEEVAGTVLLNSDREQPLLIWFLLVKSGYDARIGFSGEQTYVLFPSRNMVYNTPYYELDGNRYYLSFLGSAAREVTSLYTYDGSYKEASRPIDFAVREIPGISKTPYEKSLTFSYDDLNYEVAVRLNKNMVDFFDTYPSTSLDVYFTASISEETSQSLLGELMPVIAGREERDAVNLLLRFVQTGFPYLTDDEQFGREKFMFPEETLYYPYSDCEDRSFLFSFLVSNLTGLDVIGLDYPGHVATAVRFTSPFDGDSVTYDGVTYIICDPTYINADSGECMPAYQGVHPEIVPFQAVSR